MSDEMAFIKRADSGVGDGMQVSSRGRRFISAEGMTVLGRELLLFLPLAWDTMLRATVNAGRANIALPGCWRSWDWYG